MTGPFRLRIMNESDKSSADVEQLNLLGKAAYLGGSAVRLAAGWIDTAVHQAAGIYVETERAFKQGLDPNIEDAKIIEESEN